MNFFYDFQSSLGRFSSQKRSRSMKWFKHIQEFFTLEKLLNFHDAEVFHTSRFCHLLKFLRGSRYTIKRYFAEENSQFACLFRDVCLISDVWACVYLQLESKLIQKAKNLHHFCFFNISRLTVDMMSVK